MHDSFEVDYLVVGAGAAGMAFTDEILSHSDATVAIVDRREAPGGHWLDAYSHVRLHQPSTFYGVSSLSLGRDTIDRVGPNAGFYELADADEIRAYYLRVMQHGFLPTGRVRYFPSCDYVGDGRFESRITARSWQISVKRKLVDTTYLEGSIPATSAPPFEVEEGVVCCPAGGIAKLAVRADRYAVIGGGKTALDTIIWLLAQGVQASDITWIKPREAWWLNRKFQQPLTLVTETYRGLALQMKAIAEAGSIGEVFENLESEGLFARIEPAVQPTMFRGAIVSESELKLLRSIRSVVRMGRVRKIDVDKIYLENGQIQTNRNTVHVHCAARGLANRPLRRIFEPSEITVQPFLWGFSCYQFAMLGVVEATIASDEEKNQLCQPLAYWDRAEDYLSAFLATMRVSSAQRKYSAVQRWVKTTRLNPTNGVAEHQDDPRVIEARDAIKRFGPMAVKNLQMLLA